MSLVLFVGEGPRDEAILPALVRSLCPCVFTESFVPWNGLRMNKGAASRLDALRAVAAGLELKRCRHAEHTGLSAFNDDLCAELVPALTAVE